jgi:Skp family chaperone for outer membrane proteins
MILIPAVLLAQTPPAGQAPPTQAPPPQTAPPQAPATPPRPAAAPAGPLGGTKVAVIDVQRAISENANGRKAISELNATGQKKQAELEAKQKAIQDNQQKLQTGDKVLNDAAKADLQRAIQRDTTALERDTADAQAELQELQNRLIAPIAQLTQRVLNAYAEEMGFAVVFDISSQASTIVFHSDLADITTEIIRRVDAEIAKTSKQPGNQK